MFKTLLVEDNLSFRSIFKDHLRLQFPRMKIFEASDGSAALAQVESDIPDLIFMDINLPDQNGLTLTREIKERHPEVVVIVLTTYNVPEYREAALEFRADDFLVKDSVSTTEVITVVLSILGKKGFKTDGS
jgi:DNA-binding NarL/FixJ family response regulator